MADEGGRDERRERRLLRAGRQPGASLLDRLAWPLHRLAWRSPVHRLRLRGRYPLQLLVVPADPLPGNPQSGWVLQSGAMAYGDEVVSRDALARTKVSPAFADHVESFAWTRDLAAAAAPEQARPVAEAIAGDWVKAHGRTPDATWRPDLWGRRMLFWIAYAPLLMGGDDAEHRKAMLNAMARGARHLDRAANAAPVGLPRIAAWIGVVAAGLAMPLGDVRVARGEAGLARALAQAVHEDGGLATRSPALQLQLVELLVQLRQVYLARERPMPLALQATLVRAVSALLGVTLGDGALSSWQSGNPLGRERVARALAAADVRAESLLASRDWGYQQLVAGPVRVVIDAGPPPAGQAIAASASTLAFELADGDRRLVVNCGGGERLPPELAAALRTTAAHSTLTLADTNSTALHPDGSLGRGVTEVAIDRHEEAGVTSVEARHDGYVRRLGFRHVRHLALASDGLVSGEDRLVPAGRRRAPAATPFAIRFHLAPGLEPVVTADGQGALLRLGSRAWQFRAEAGTLAVEQSLWVDGAGRPRTTDMLVVSGETDPDGAAIGWSFRPVR